ncbi:ABC-type sugar transport system permease component [Bifidobacterium longum subsp. longum JDM301]|jgi:N,N'-diacetylchitobiose transport system permease protein|uniref:ABC-type sugar transport system permease component n=2 Tax=Bifidobacterium longum TaxID=216816 RepID=D6ZVF6_BIFLJ|nr:carbohydrate ABC transporter permease [Bifidobacterium longum]ADH00862.1 ABC-type sugar transport system permease component [Bifidobacterium longum subsp. longum JDM301]
MSTSMSASPAQAVSQAAAQSASPRRRTNPGKIARRAGTTILALLFCVVWFFPVYWMIITAVKPRDEIMTTTPVFWPTHLSFDNFIVAVTQTSFLTNLKNSVVVTAISIVLSIIVAFFACAALTLYRFRGRKPIMVFVLAIQMTSGGIIPQFIIYNQLGLLNKYSGLILAYIAMVLPFAIWNMRGFFLNIPKDIFESAAVEGANDWQILWKITFPLAAPGIVSTSVFAFINAWNDYMIAYTFMKDQSKYTLPVWLSSFSTPTMGTDFGGQMAASVIFSLPVVVFFMLIQRNIMKGVTTGAVK